MARMLPLSLTSDPSPMSLTSFQSRISITLLFYGFHALEPDGECDFHLDVHINERDGLTKAMLWRFQPSHNAMQGLDLW